MTIANLQFVTRALDQTQGLLKAALDVVPAPVAILDDAGSILLVNESWRRFLRKLQLLIPAAGVGGQYLGIAFFGSIERRHALALRMAMKALLHGAVGRFQHAIHARHAGAERWYQVSAARFRIDGSARIVVTHEDVSAAHEAQETIKDLSQRLLSLQEEERQRIALELHDSTAQQLTAIGLHMMSLRRSSRNDPETQRTIDQVEQSIEEAQKEIRTFSYLLYPPDLDRDGLKTILTRFIDGYAKRTLLRATAQIADDVDDFAPDVQRALLRIIQEALANVHRHASATEVRIKVKTTPKVLLFSVSDNGRGIAKCCNGNPTAMHPPGLGLTGMQARLRQLGGVLKITSGPHGTAISGRVPLAQCTDERVPLMRGASSNSLRVIPLHVSG